MHTHTLAYILTHREMHTFSYMHSYTHTHSQIYPLVCTHTHPHTPFKHTNTDTYILAEIVTHTILFTRKNVFKLLESLNISDQ